MATAKAGNEPVAAHTDAIRQTRNVLVDKIGRALHEDGASNRFFTLFNGGASQPSAHWKARLATLAQNPGAVIGAKIVQLGNEELKGAYGAFTRSGADGTPAIYLNQFWLSRYANKKGLERVLAEEMGHAIDHYLNGNMETSGDEGEAFAHSLLQQQLTAADIHRVHAEDDFAVLMLEGKEVVIEEAAIYLNEVNEGSGTGYTLQSSRLNNITQVQGTGFRFTSVDPNAALFAYDTNGNDISGTLSYVNAAGTLITIPGVMSRQEKQGSTTRAFYFLDPATTKAYLLVVPGFEPTFTSGNVGTSSDPNFLNDLNGVLSSQNSTPRIVVSSPAISEGAGVAIFEITSTNTPTGSYTFTPAIVAGSATAVSDYTATLEYRNSATSNVWTQLSGALTIAASETLTQLRVAIIDDATVEASEDFSVTTGGITGGGFLNNGGTFGLATIQDNDAPVPTITYSPNPIVKTYGDAAFFITPQTNSTGAISYAVTGAAGIINWNSTNNNFDILKAGTTQVTINQAASSAYTSGSLVVNVTVNPRTLTVTASASDKVYDGNNTATATLSDNRVSGDVLTVSNTGITFSDANVGTGKTVTVAGISISGAAAANYTVAATATTTASITPKAATVTISPATKVYGAADPSFVGTPAGLVGGDQLSGTVIRTAGTAVGNYAFSGLSNSNYTITYSPANFSITARTLTVTASASDKVYDGNNTATATLSDNRVSGDVLTVSNTGITFSDANVGTGKTVTVAGISISGAAAANYTVAATATTTASITPKAATVTISPATKVYGAADPSFVGTPAGLVGGDQLSGTVIRTAGTAVGNYAFSGLSNSNYTITYSPANFSITARTLTVTATASDKVYDGNNTATATLSDNRVSGDVLTVSNTGITFSDANVGTGKTVTVAGISISGAAAANYTVAATATTTANITPKAATVAVSPSSKLLGMPDPAFTYTTSGLVVGDQLTGTVTRAAGSNMGSYAFSGLSNSNYTITYSPANFSITQGTLTIGAQPQGAALCQGGTLSLSVSASNAAGYQWFKDNTPIAGATGSTYTKANVTAADAGSYYVAISGTVGYGSATSTNATVTVAQPVTATVAFTGNAAFCPGSSVVLSANAGAVSYQWFRNGTVINGATARTYTATAPGNYTVTINMGTACGNTTSAAFAYTVDANGDCDGDGIINSIECPAAGSCPDTDGDGTEDYLDLDSDNDGISDNIEKGPAGTPVDTDGDGVPDFRDLDSDNDGIADAVEKGPNATPADTDGDGTPDFRDLDSDNDGIPDAVEKGPNATPRDTDGDGVPDFRDLDSDNDGLTDAQERGTGTTPVDTDGDGVPDFRDLDSDNDGITDAIEKGNGTQPVDTDGDGTPDFRDLDSDNDGITDRIERGNSIQPLDTDGDGIPDFRELDADNDGKPDAEEGGTEDCDNDGVPNFRDEEPCITDILMPDVFTPNGDGHNDVIKPVLPGIATFKSFRVFNRWGNLMFETSDKTKGWDGRLRGQLQPTETYLWTAEGIDRNGRTIVRRGTLSLVR